MRYRKGDMFESTAELVAWLESGNSVYIHGKYWNNKWAVNLQLGWLMAVVRNGVACRAVKNKHECYEQDKEFIIEERIKGRSKNGTV